MTNLRLTSIALIILILIGLFAAAFILDETQQAIILKFGKPVRTVTTAGIHFKIPLIQSITIFDKRILEWDGNPQEIPTKDNKFIFIDTYARWRISDPMAFYKALRTELIGYSRLDDLLDGAVRDEIANNLLPEIIRSTDRRMTMIEVESAKAIEDIDTSLVSELNIPGNRHEITENIVRNVDQKLKELNLGIEVIDLQIKKVNYNTEVQKRVFDRMISEQRRIAEKYRALGQGEKQRILGKQDQKKKEILSQAYLEAQTIRGEADARAVQIYANAYNKSPDSRDFYQLLRTLETYRVTMDSATTLILSTDSDYLKYLKSGK